MESYFTNSDLLINHYGMHLVYKKETYWRLQTTFLNEAKGRTDIRKNSKMADYLDWALLTFSLIVNFTTIGACVFLYFCWSKVVRKKRCYPTSEETDIEKTGNLENSLHNGTRNISTRKQTFKITQPKIIRRNTQT